MDTSPIVQFAHHKHFIYWTLHPPDSSSAFSRPWWTVQWVKCPWWVKCLWWMNCPVGEVSMVGELSLVGELSSGWSEIPPNNVLGYWNENPDFMFRFNNPKHCSNSIILVSFDSSRRDIKYAVFIFSQMFKDFEFYNVLFNRFNKQSDWCQGFRFNVQTRLKICFAHNFLRLDFQVVP